MLFSYFIVSADKNHVYWLSFPIFYIIKNDKHLKDFFFQSLYINPKRITDQLKTYLAGVQIKDYQSIFEDVSTFSKNKIIWVSPMSSYAIYQAVVNKVCKFKLSLKS